VKPPRGKRVDPQSRPAEFSAAAVFVRASRDLRTPAFVFGGLAACTFRGQSATTGFGAAISPAGCVTRFVAVSARRGEPFWDRGTSASPCGYLASLGSSTGRDWATVPADRSWAPDRASRRALYRGRWRVCRHSTRPVLKHGPRSLTCARVIGLYETQRRSESEGRLGLTQVGSFSLSGGEAHHRPVPSASSVGRS
jgi:hypothetical protein